MICFWEPCTKIIVHTNRWRVDKFISALINVIRSDELILITPDVTISIFHPRWSSTKCIGSSLLGDSTDCIAAWWINVSNIDIHSGWTSRISGNMDSASPLTSTPLFCLNQADFHPFYHKYEQGNANKPPFLPQNTWCSPINVQQPTKCIFCVRRWQLCVIRGQLYTDGEWFYSTLMLDDKLFCSNFWLWWKQWDPTRQSECWYVLRCILGRETFFTISISQRGLLLWVSIKRYD